MDISAKILHWNLSVIPSYPEGVVRKSTGAIEL